MTKEIISSRINVFEREMDWLYKNPCLCRRRPKSKTENKGAASAPIVQMKSVLTTAFINEMERRDVAIADVPGAFLTAQMDEEVHMMIYGEMSEAMQCIFPDNYDEYV